MKDIKDKISKILALAESPNENEAKAALLKAREMMAKHKIDESDLKKVKEQQVVRDIIRDVSYTAMTNPWIGRLSGIIGEHYCCKAVVSHFQGRRVYHPGFIGLEDDFAVCKKIFMYAVDSVMSKTGDLKAMYPGASKRKIREALNAYGFGFCDGLYAAFAEQNKEHQEWGLVLAIPKEVNDALGGMKERHMTARVRADQLDALRMGYADGVNFDVHSRLEG